MSNITGTAGTALITGAASGIGRCFASRLGAAGHELALLDVDAQGLNATVQALGGPRAGVAAAIVDVADRRAVESTVGSLIGSQRGLDLLVTCAAILGPGTWSEQSPEEFERVLRVDLGGTVHVVRAALPALRRARGHVIVLASTAAVHGWPGLAAYAAAKFALVGWCEAVRAELAGDGIGLTTVFPLLIDTPLIDRPGLPPILRRGRRIPADTVVDKALRAAARRRRRVYVPGTVRLLAFLHGVAPSLLDWYGARFGIEH